MLVDQPCIGQAEAPAFPPEAQLAKTDAVFPQLELKGFAANTGLWRAQQLRTETALSNACALSSHPRHGLAHALAFDKNKSSYSGNSLHRYACAAGTLQSWIPPTGEIVKPPNRHVTDRVVCRLAVVKLVASAWLIHSVKLSTTKHWHDITAHQAQAAGTRCWEWVLPENRTAASKMAARTYPRPTAELVARHV